MKLLRICAGSLLEVLYPETCLWCGAARGQEPWSVSGPRVKGLRAWDRPHTCRSCGDLLSRTAAVRGVLPGGLPVWAGVQIDAGLVDVVSAWKYHGLRGLAWPLGRLAAGAVSLAACDLACDPVVLPIPLHRGRRRRRGFNQAEMLVRLLEETQGCRTAWGVLERHRATAQQARISDPGRRRKNVAGAFRVRRAPTGGGGVLLLDDLVTTGATMAAAAGALAAAGVAVAGAVCLGLAAALRSTSGG